jgi:hypothetical protein
VWKIDVFNEVARLGLDLALIKRYSNEIGSKQSEIRRRKGAQQSILSGSLWVAAIQLPS